MTTLTEADALDGTARCPRACSRTEEQVAQRLLDSSAKHSFDPDKELDWDAPFEEGKWFWPPELVSLYDTPLWKRMSEEQRILLSQHEAAALASLGIWFEIILMQLLVRHIYDKAATSAHVRYALTEIEDECRHSKMFARLISHGGTPWYPVSRVPPAPWAASFKTISTTPGSFTATLLGEEVLDWMQRLTFPDERVQPLIRGVTRIHVVEEARHVRYAREELRRQMVTAPKWSQVHPHHLRDAPGVLGGVREPRRLHERGPGQAGGPRAGEGERPSPRGHAERIQAVDGLPGRHRGVAGGRAAVVEVVGVAGLGANPGHVMSMQGDYCPP
ncbi:hypothetical protein SVIOM74S_07414 [Streptomyces violarus]